MDWTTVIGLAIGLVITVVSITLEGDLGPFLHLPSFVLVLGGTLAATIAGSSAAQIRSLPAVARVAFEKRAGSGENVVARLVALANKARREGLLALEDEVAESDDPFLYRGVQLVVDGADPEMVRSILEIELTALEERHRAGQQMFLAMGSYAPAFGMLGTLVGLIQMLRSLDNPDAIGPGMALALITTLYGVVMANLCFLPIAEKLKRKSAFEIQEKEVMIEGVLSIQAGENPRMIERKLLAFLRSTRDGDPGPEVAEGRTVVADVS